MSQSSNGEEGKATKMKVAVRLRPVLKKADEEKKLCVQGLDDTSLEIWNWRDYRQTIKYNCDAFVDTSSTQSDVYERCVKTLIMKTLHGQNASIFAYGPTGAGKTYTMLGTAEQPGIIPRAVDHIFSATETLRNDASNSQWNYKLSFSYLEIYQEKVYDLLEVKTQDLPIREDRDRTIFIPNLAEKPIDSLQQFNELFVPASKNRTTAATKLNSRSSRSHSILLLKVVKQQNLPPYKKQVGKAYLIDLAGSENNKKTGNQGIRLKESGAINTSLFVLGQVVDALNQGLARIPYRDSKLTRLLQDSLGGGAHACMITNIAPEEASYMETYTALNFASKSRQIVNRPFTRETIEKPVIKLPPKRQNSSDDSQPPPRPSPAKKSRQDSTGDSIVVNPAKPQENSLGLSPLLKRQASFEENVKQRLQAFENDILTRSHPSTNESQQHKSHDQPDHEMLKQLKESAHLLSELQKQSRNFQQAVASTSATDELNVSQQTDIDNSENGDVGKNPARCSSTVPRAVVQPMQVSSQSNIAPAATLIKHPKPDIQHMKTKAASDSYDSKENTSQLQPNLELQAKHTAEIIQLLNTGSVKQLKSLQSVGEKRAQLIYSWRQMFGGFTKIDDLRKVTGLPSKTADAIIRNNLCNDTAQA